MQFIIIFFSFKHVLFILDYIVLIVYFLHKSLKVLFNHPFEGAKVLNFSLKFNLVFNKDHKNIMQITRNGNIWKKKKLININILLLLYV